MKKIWINVIDYVQLVIHKNIEFSESWKQLLVWRLLLSKFAPVAGWRHQFLIICTIFQQHKEPNSRLCFSLQSASFKEHLHSSYIQKICVPASTVVGHEKFRSADQFCLVVPPCQWKSMQKRGFWVVGTRMGQMACNSLPATTRVQIAENSNISKQLIKTYLFDRDEKYLTIIWNWLGPALQGPWEDS